MASRTVAGGPSEASDHRKRERPDFPTAAAVADGIHAVWYLIRDPAGVDNALRTITGGLALRARPPATVRNASGVFEGLRSRSRKQTSKLFRQRRGEHQMLA